MSCFTGCFLNHSENQKFKIMQKFFRFLMAGSMLAALCACERSGDSKQPANWLKLESTQNGQQDVYLKFGKEWRRMNVSKVVMLNPVRALGLAESPRYQLLQPGTLIPKTICAGGQLNWAPGRKYLDCTIAGRDETRYKVEQMRYDLNGDVISQYQTDIPYADQELVAASVFYGANDQRYYLLRQMLPGSTSVRSCVLAYVASEGKAAQLTSDSPVNATQCADAAFWSAKAGSAVIAVTQADIF